MQVHYDEGVAIHIDPEPCVGVRKDAGEAQGRRRSGGGGWSKMSDEALVREHEAEALVRANAAPRCGARSKRTGKPCRGAAMPNGRCKVHGGKSTGPRTPEGLARSRRANWKHGYFSREAKAERSRVRQYLRSAICATRSKGLAVPDTDQPRIKYGRQHRHWPARRIHHHSIGRTGERRTHASGLDAPLASYTRDAEFRPVVMKQKPSVNFCGYWQRHATK